VLPPTVELRPSSEFSLADVASVFTASYQGYFVPFTVDEKQLGYMVDVFDLDLDRSLVAVERESLVGVANLGRREESTWLGGVGVVPSRRGAGVGESLTRALLFTEDGERVSLLQAGGDSDDLDRLTAALRSRGTVSAVNFPAGEPVANALRGAGATVPIRQHEMLLRF
jgi:GNAT superfamily N-acetyltransferase